MALRKLTRRQLSYVLGSQQLASDFDTAWTTGSAATPETEMQHRLPFNMANRRAAGLLYTALDADSALDDFTQQRLAYAMGSQIHAALVAAGLG